MIKEPRKSVIFILLCTTYFRHLVRSRGYGRVNSNFPRKAEAGISVHLIGERTGTARAFDAVSLFLAARGGKGAHYE